MMRTCADSSELGRMISDLAWVLDDATHDELEIVQSSLSEIGEEADLRDFFIYCIGFGEGQKTLERVVTLRTMPYRDYLRTPEWQERRHAQLQRDGHRCRVCNASAGLQVHHRTYDNRGVEQPGDLITLCGGCHQDFHSRRKLVRS